MIKEPTSERVSTSLDIAEPMMEAFADRTGLSRSDREARRYLWTDAFAVCNFLELYRQTGKDHHLEMAARLVDQVHSTLGRHRADDSRSGWISGLSDEQGRVHPTRGGLRIGKKLNERGPREPYDPHSEWDRDGQYFHYLTRWMHALSRFAEVAGEEQAARWARELAKAAYAGFSFATPSGRPGLHWKMSIDLSRPLVPSMGQHDPLDGLITFMELFATGATLDPTETPALEEEITALEVMCEGVDWTTTDPLGLGGLLADAYRVAQLIVRGGTQAHAGLLERILHSAAVGLDAFSRSGLLQGPAAARLAFRELGLAIGLRAIAPMTELVDRGGASAFARSGEPLAFLQRFSPVASAIERFWLEEPHQQQTTWKEHLDINAVMLATSLAPASYLAI